MTGLPWVWGETAGTSAPAASVAPAARSVCLTRAVRVAAPPASVYRWLCQLRLAPYSYDLVDNGGRRSPRRLVDGVDSLEVGMRAMSIFTVTAVEPGREVRFEITARRALAVFGPVTVVYRAVPVADGTVLRADLFLEPGRGRCGRARTTALAWGDLVMMRRQLRTLAALSERYAG